MKNRLPVLFACLLFLIFAKEGWAAPTTFSQF